MKSISISLPNVVGEHSVEVDVKINGVKTSYLYKVEIFKWEDCLEEKEDRIQCIKKLVTGYSQDWELSQIGTPTEEYIPITFQRKTNK